MGEFWVSALVGGLGLALMAATAVLGLLHAVHVGSQGHWVQKPDKMSFIAFAWGELGRGLFHGYLLALGMSPLTAFFFLGQQHFWISFAFFTGLVWALGAIVMYFWTVLCGVVGFVRYHKQAQEIGSLNAFTQFAVVLLMSAPLGYVLVRFLLPPADQVITILVETMRFHYAHVMA